jgi:DNA repair protein RecO (recombination protein O)
LQWSDDAIVLGLRRQGETSVILELMTRDHGRHLGLVQGGRSRRMQPVLQPGNGVQAVWRARLDEQLGNYAVEGGTLRAGRYLGSPLALYGIATLASHLRLLPDRDPHPALFDTASILADHLDDPQVAPTLFVRFELMLLADLGFGLDLSECAATGQTDELIYVSPRSGRAVSREAGEPYRAKLFELPRFLRAEPSDQQPEPGELAAGFQLTGHFLDAYIYEPRGQRPPEERGRFVALATSATARVSGMFSDKDGTATDSARNGET